MRYSTKVKSILYTIVYNITCIATEASLHSVDFKLFEKLSFQLTTAKFPFANNTLIDLSLQQ